MIKEIKVSGGYLYLAGGATIPCCVGKSGVTADKKEGDGATPTGRFALRLCYYRADRLSLPATGLQTLPLSPYDGWCDDPAHPDYNTHVKLPFDARHEQLWRADHAYDIVIPLGYNDDPVVAGQGSAIFFHLMHDSARPTEGCVAIAVADMLALLPELSPNTMMEIAP